MTTGKINDPYTHHHRASACDASLGGKQGLGKSHISVI